MEKFEYISSIDNVEPFIIWTIFILSFLYLYYTLRKLKMSYISYFFVLVGFAGVFEYIGGFVFRLFSLFVFLFVVFNIFTKRKGRAKIVPILLFYLYSIAYFFMIAFHSFSNPLSDLRQYIIYAMPFLVFILFDKDRYRINYSQEIEVIVRVLNVQILAAILKFILVGFNEKMVGTMTISGGVVAAIFPIIYFVVIWFKKEGKLIKNDWYWILSSLLVAIVSNKRATWFLFPLTIFIFINPRLNFKRILIIMLVPFMFYFGVRFNPSLNPEGEIWGSFNIDYVTKYIIKYNLGSQDVVNTEVGIGRMGTNIYFINQLYTDFFNEINMFGYGNAEYNKQGGKDTNNVIKFGFSSKYMLTGWVSILVKFGSIVLASIVMFFLYIIRSIKNTRDYLLMLFVFFSWFLFYSGAIITNLMLLNSFLFSIFIIQYNDNSQKNG